MCDRCAGSDNVAKMQVLSVGGGIPRKGKQKHHWHCRIKFIVNEIIKILRIFTSNGNVSNNYDELTHPKCITVLLKHDMDKKLFAI